MKCKRRKKNQQQPSENSLNTTDSFDFFVCVVYVHCLPAATVSICNLMFCCILFNCLIERTNGRTGGRRTINGRIDGWSVLFYVFLSIDLLGECVLWEFVCVNQFWNYWALFLILLFPHVSVATATATATTAIAFSFGNRILFFLHLYTRITLKLKTTDESHYFMETTHNIQCVRVCEFSYMFIMYFYDIFFSNSLLIKLTSEFFQIKCI